MWEVPLRSTDRSAPIAQPAEAADLKSAQCEFESRWGHSQGQSDGGLIGKELRRLGERAMTHDRRWYVGVCANCLIPLDPQKVKRDHVAFCSTHCRLQAEGIRYIRRSIRDGRIADRMTAQVIFNNKVLFLAADLAYVRPRLTPGLRAEVLSDNDGLCVICNKALATEVDHIRGGSIDRSNLRGVCRECHESKPRGPVPDDLTRDGQGTVDCGDETTPLLVYWAAVLDRGDSLDDSDGWQELRRCARQYSHTRFGWITEQILTDRPESPAHDEVTWRRRRRQYCQDYLDWAADSG